MDAVKMNGFRHNVKRWMEKTQSENEAVAEKSVLEKPLKLPCLSHAPSGYIQVASNAVDICYSNTMGRHVVAAENIYPGIQLMLLNFFLYYETIVMTAFSYLRIPFRFVL